LFIIVSNLSNPNGTFMKAEDAKAEEAVDAVMVIEDEDESIWQSAAQARGINPS